MNNNGKISIKESKTNLMRWAGVSAMLAGLCFIVVGMFHPVNVPSSVTTATWINVHIFAVAMGFFGLFGMAGLYARQAEKSGWLGLAGFVLFSLWLGLMMPFSFVESFILPSLATESPAFVEGFLGMFTGIPSEIDLGVLPTLWNISGPLYIFGPLLFGIATFRARVLPRWAGALLVIGAVLVPVGALVPPEYQPRIMLPAGLALAWLGYALFSERRERLSESLLDQRTARPEPSRVA
jgi:hypothetical protein